MVDTAEKRKAAAGVARPWMRTQEPNAAKDADWRKHVANSYPLAFGNIFLATDDVVHTATEHVLTEPAVKTDLAADNLTHTAVEHVLTEPVLAKVLAVDNLTHTATEHVLTEPTVVVHNAPTFDGPNIPNQSNFKDQAIPTFDETARWTEDGGGDPTTWSIQAGVLPTGLTLNTSAGTIDGTPTVEETQPGIVIRATNTYGFADSNAFDWEIVPFVAGTGENQQTGISIQIGLHL